MRMVLDSKKIEVAVSCLWVTFSEHCKDVIIAEVYIAYAYFRFKHIQVRSFIKKRLQNRCFPMKFQKIFKNTYFEEHLRAAASCIQ